MPLPNHATVPVTHAMRMLTNSSTATSFPAVADSASAYTAVDSGTPTGNYAVFDPDIRPVVSMQFFGTDAANETFDVLILGVKKYAPNGDYTTDVVAQLSVTLGALTGRSGGTVTDSELYADTITASVKPDGAEVVSPAGDRKATFRFNNDGYEQIIVLFDLTGAASANGLYWLS